MWQSHMLIKRNKLSLFVNMYTVQCLFIMLMILVNYCKTVYFLVPHHVFRAVLHLLIQSLEPSRIFQILY